MIVCIFLSTIDFLFYLQPQTIFNYDHYYQVTIRNKIQLKQLKKGFERTKRTRYRSL